MLLLWGCSDEDLERGDGDATLIREDRIRVIGIVPVLLVSAVVAGMDDGVRAR